jgi:phosphatidylglycerol---prolipoprotein diacylglyceryl transferase
MWIHTLNPVLVSFGPVAIRWYGLVFLFGALLAYWMLDKARKAGKLGLSKNEISDLIVWMVVGVVLGSRVFFFAFYRPDLFSLFDFFAVWQGGLSFHGGLVGVVFAVYWFCKRKEIEFLHLADVLSAPLMIALAFGRIANFINGELWGTVSKASWCVNFRNSGGGDVCRHPYQLYDGVKRFAVFFWLVFLNKKSFASGFVFWNLVFFEGLGRFVLDFWKDEIAYVGLTSGQWLSLVMVVVALWFFIAKHKEDWKNVFS